ncbi:hypothetical protein C0J52_02183 [Blattella germanica]|nr:hypothetical protein C0J52_02183 [Blattella germanica]
MLRVTLFLLLVACTAIQGRTVKRVPIIRDNRIVNGVNANVGEYPKPQHHHSAS